MENLDRYVGKLLDRRYRIRRVIGVGGMAVVFEAADLVMNRIVAVKMLKEDMANDEMAVQRFINESKAVSMLSHPNIVKIFDVSVKGSLKYFVMERIEGITLKSYMQRKGALSTDEVLSYSEQVLRALEHAHSKGIVHRDIKPQNILLLKNGRVKVTDFGIAMLEDGDLVPTEDKAIGTVYYISPEQANGRDVDHRSDLYSLGVTMYEMATGTLPFNADTPVSVAMKQVKEQATPPTEVNPDIPYGLEQIILGAMEKSADRRFQTAEQMLRYVSRLRDNNNLIFKTRKPEPDEETAGIDTDVKKKKHKRRRRESRSMFPIILGVTVAFLIVFVTSAITILDLVLKDQSLNAPITVEVPDVTGEAYDGDASKLVDTSFFKIEVEYVFDASAPENTIIKQDPEGGSSRRVIKDKQKSVIRLTVSKGAKMLTVPDYSVMDYRAAKLAAEKLGFRCELREVANDVVDPGVVLYTEPAAKTPITYGSTLVIYYSRGPVIERVDVPVLTGLTPMEAYRKMAGNFRVGTVTSEYSETVAAGLILSQGVPSGTQAVKGTIINFVLSMGPAPETAETQETDDPFGPDLPPDADGGPAPDEGGEPTPDEGAEPTPDEPVETTPAP